ncbi:MAG: endonuclease domain-containing protein [Bacteroidetes bacterium]|nr:endonuclease domain-containing protein [Bacteroidota bacterium]MBU1116350.1 endonuclease domain-containing protein [Bacteroidota bacterium]MBU1800374.1 endonuclease domain-containing protein [Bacteroidota bacterium]
MRTEIIVLLGIEVIRFTNEEVENNLNAVIKMIISKLN